MEENTESFEERKEEAKKVLLNADITDKLGVYTLITVLQNFDKPLELTAFLKGYFLSSVMSVQTDDNEPEIIQMLRLEKFKADLLLAFYYVSSDEKEFTKGKDISNNCVVDMAKNASEGFKEMLKDKEI